MVDMVQFRVEGAFDAEQFGAWRSQDQHHDAVRAVRLSNLPERRENERVIARVGSPPVLDRASFDTINAAVRAWIASPRPLRVNRGATLESSLKTQLEDAMAVLRRTSVEKGIDPLTDPVFLQAIGAWGQTETGPLFAVPGLHDGDLQQWAQEKYRRIASAKVYVFVGPLN
ncbi:MAG TPA: hypothetical protein VFN21_00730 [Acidimicrobiales bacterium]|nr:hypothetical protein [Acidimicrobiales bacterium]